MSTERMQPRPIDHLVLPTASLETARSRLSVLGFTVAPNGIHPFGTANCCVYLADGSFLEPLATVDQAAASEAIQAKNAFVAHQRDYQSRRGLEGFSAIVFGTDDAKADDSDFVSAGYSGGQMLEFSRDFVGSAGAKDTASFRLAFTKDIRTPDCLLFTCQRINAPKVDRTVLQSHPNGVKGLKSVILAGPRAPTYAAWVAAAGKTTDLEIEGENSVSLPGANAAIRLISAATFERDFGLELDDESDMLARAIVFSVEDIRATEAYFASWRVPVAVVGQRVVVRATEGQGAIFVFEAIS